MTGTAIRTLVFGLSALAICQVAAGPASAQTTEGGSVKMFNGKNLEGWV
jgi:hypothetical protein